MERKDNVPRWSARMKPGADEVLLREAEDVVEMLLKTVEQRAPAETGAELDLSDRARIDRARRFLRELRPRVMVGWGYAPDFPRCEHGLPLQPAQRAHRCYDCLEEV